MHRTLIILKPLKNQSDNANRSNTKTAHCSQRSQFNIPHILCSKLPASSKNFPQPIDTFANRSDFHLNSIQQPNRTINILLSINWYLLVVQLLSRKDSHSFFDGIATDESLTIGDFFFNFGGFKFGNSSHFAIQNFSGIRIYQLFNFSNSEF